MLFGLLCMALLFATLFPETPVGRLLKVLLIEAPARRLSKIRRGHLILAVGIVLLSAALILVAKTEGAFLVAGSVPEGVAWIVTFDIATYVDVIAVVWLALATVRLRAIWRFAKTALMAALRGGGRLVLRIAARERSRRKARPTSRPTNDDDGGGWLAPAYASA